MLSYITLILNLIFVYLLSVMVIGESDLLKIPQTEVIVHMPYTTNSQTSKTDTINYKQRKSLIFAILLPSRVSKNSNDCIYQKVMPVLELGVKQIQKKGLPFENFDITLVFRDTNCSSVYGPIGFFEIYTKRKIDAIFGLSCDYVLAPISRYAGVWDIPVLTTSGFPRPFDIKTSYPTLTRLMGSYTEVGTAVKGILDMFNWTTIAMIYQNYEDRKIQGNSNCYLSLGAINYIIRGVVVESFNGEANEKNITVILDQIKTKARIIVMCADPKSIRQIMLVAEALNMVDSGEYVFFNIELFSSIPQVATKPWFDKNDTDENNERAKKAYTALLTVTAKQPDNPEYLAFSEEVKRIAAEKYNYTFKDNEPVSTFVTSFYDAVLLYAYALNESLTRNPNSLIEALNGSEIVQFMWNRSFHGITGNVTIDANGDRISMYSLLDMNSENNQFEIVAHYFYNHLEYVFDKKIHWAGGRIDPPLDRPVCGFDGTLCPDTSLPGYAILSLVLGLTIIIMAIISIFGYRHYKSEAEINSMIWKINPNEVLPCHSYGKQRGSMYSLVKRGSQTTLYSEDIGSLAGDRQLFIPIGFYKGCKVAIKRINNTNINLNRSLMLELKQMKDIQHEHLVKFYGACLDPPLRFFLTEYCPKGSLQDILENDQINLDWMFKLSLMHDIVRGMHYIHHSDIRSHGNLKSSNCVVDSRFVLKITDFGLHQLRIPNIEDDVENFNSYAYWRRLLWTAPELLRLEKPPPKGTQKGDVYSFGIIVHEITTRQGPFFIGNENKSPEEIITLIMHGPSDTNPQPFRPQIDDSAFDDVNILMTKCWAEEPSDRPEFGYLKATIHRINKNNETGNIVDNLLQRMEQYANNLEGLVEERTRDYLEEKKKCEKLLYQLLPESVAAQLICGKPVIAETFDQVTIYFSDIVGFTAISAESTPMQVVNFLNDLYTCFDSIVENYDVYKVETIGDAYMVVSGLPVRNGNLHAREIARLALALLDAVKKFKIRHRPDDQLKLRIGLHSGPCVAGVVGLKMPRYCLFGDTVNTASRMESNGEALKIHISHSTKEILDTFAVFNISKRGYMKIKGKGDMLTYWLQGEQILNSDIKLDKLLNCTKNNCVNNSVDNFLNGNYNSLNTIQAKCTCIGSNNDIKDNCNRDFDLVKSNCNLGKNCLNKSSSLKAYKNKCNVNDDNVKNATQPLLAKINS